MTKELLKDTIWSDSAADAELITFVVLSGTAGRLGHGQPQSKAA